MQICVSTCKITAEIITIMKNRRKKILCLILSYCVQRVPSIRHIVSADAIVCMLAQSHFAQVQTHIPEFICFSSNHTHVIHDPNERVSELCCNFIRVYIFVRCSLRFTQRCSDLIQISARRFIVLAQLNSIQRNRNRTVSASNIAMTQKCEYLM